MLNWLTKVMCCTQLPPSSISTSTTTTSKPTPIRVPLSPNITLLLKQQQKTIYNNRVTNPSQMKIMFIKQVSKEESYSEVSRVLSRMRNSSNGLREFMVRVVDEEEEQEQEQGEEGIEGRMRDRMGEEEMEKGRVDLKNLEHYQRMEKLLVEIKRLAVIGHVYQISLFFDTEITPHKSQILLQILPQFRSLSSESPKTFTILITTTSPEQTEAIKAIRDQVVNNALMDTQKFFTNYQDRTICMENGGGRISSVYL